MPSASHASTSMIKKGFGPHGSHGQAHGHHDGRTHSTSDPQRKHSVPEAPRPHSRATQLTATIGENEPPGMEMRKVDLQKQSSSLVQPKELTEMDEQIMKERRAEIQKEIQAIRNRIKPPFLIVFPESKLAGRWFTLNVVCLIFTAIVTPYEISLMETKLYNGLWFANRFIDAYFVSDIFYQFNLAFVRERSHTVITDRKIIAKNYLSSFFIPDFISIIPFDMLADFELGDQFRALRALRLLRLLKLVRVMKASVMIKRFERRSGYLHAHVMLIKFSIGIVVMAHWFACAWCMVASLETGDTWLTALRGYDDDDTTKESGPYENSEHFNIYSASIYWAIVTITSVGYGDISATNPAEQRICTLLVLTSSCLWAYIIGSACGIISNLDVAQIEYHQNMDQLNLFIQEHPGDFSGSLRLHMREFVHHTAALRRNEDYNENLISKMSPALQREVAGKICKWITLVPYFKNAKSAFIVSLVNASSFKLFIPQERIRTNDELKIVMKGTGSYRTKVLTKGSVWGEDFVLGFDQRMLKLRRLRNMSITLALTYFEVMMIDSETLEEVLRHYPAEEVVIMKYAWRLAAQTNLLRVAAFIKRCGSYDEAVRSFNNDPTVDHSIADISSAIKPLLEEEDNHLEIGDKDGDMSADMSADEKAKKRKSEEKEFEEKEFHPEGDEGNGSNIISSAFFHVHPSNNTGLPEPNRLWRISFEQQQSFSMGSPTMNGSHGGENVEDFSRPLLASMESIGESEEKEPPTQTPLDVPPPSSSSSMASKNGSSGGSGTMTSMDAKEILNTMKELQLANQRMEKMIKLLAKGQNLDGGGGGGGSSFSEKPTSVGSSSPRTSPRASRAGGKDTSVSISSRPGSSKDTLKNIEPHSPLNGTHI